MKHCTFSDGLQTVFPSENANVVIKKAQYASEMFYNYTFEIKSNLISTFNRRSFNNISVSPKLIYMTVLLENWRKLEEWTVNVSEEVGSNITAQRR